MSDRVTLPLNAALTGPMRRRTLAVISVSDSFSSDSQPGMQACSTAWSFNAANTLSRGAAILYSPLISIAPLRLRHSDLTPRVWPEGKTAFSRLDDHALRTARILR